MKTCVLLLLTLTLAAQAPEVTTTAKDRTSLGITLYHGNLAAVRDRRVVGLPKGPLRLAFQDVSDQMKPKTAEFRALKGASPALLERNFESRVLSPQSLATASLDQRVAIRNPRDGRLVEGRLVSVPSPGMLAPPRTPLEADLYPLEGFSTEDLLAKKHRRRLTERDPDVLVETSEGFVQASPGSMIFFDLPSSLRPRPTLLQDLENPRAGRLPFELAYLCTGLQWHVDYVAILDATGHHCDLSAKVTLTNESAAEFPNTTLQLVAGDPNQVWESDDDECDPDGVSYVLDGLTTVDYRSGFQRPTLHQERLSEYHLFTLDRPTTLCAGQTKQVSLFQAEHVPATMHFQANMECILDQVWMAVADSDDHSSRSELDPSTQIDTWQEGPPVNLFARLQNSRRNHPKLGKPLPQGHITVFSKEADNSEIHLGEGFFGATPQGADVEFAAGHVRGISWKWRLIGPKLPGAHEIQIHDPASEEASGTDGNRRRQARDLFHSQDWEVEVEFTNETATHASIEAYIPVESEQGVIASNLPHRRERPDMELFPVHVPAHDRAILHFTM